MRIFLKKFGDLLLSRQNGSEAFKAFQVILRDFSKDDELEIDFSGVLTLSPSWADEFLTPPLNQMGERLVLLPSDNLSVHATVRIFQEASKRNFKIK